MGARPLRRLIEDQIIAPVTDKLLSGEYQPGTHVTIGSGPNLEIQAPLSPMVVPPFDLGRLGQRSEPALPIGPKRPASPDDGLPHLDNVPAEDQTEFDALFSTLSRRLAAQGIALEIDRLAKYFLCAPGAAAQKPREGRPIGQAFVELIEQPLADKLLAKEFAAGDWITIDHSPDGPVIKLGGSMR